MVRQRQHRLLLARLRREERRRVEARRAKHRAGGHQLIGRLGRRGGRRRQRPARLAEAACGPAGRAARDEDEKLEEPARRLGLTGPTLSRDEDRLIVAVLDEAAVRGVGERKEVRRQAAERLAPDTPRGCSGV